MADTILNIRNLQVQFSTETEPVKAVDGISFQLQRSKTPRHCRRIGILGEISDLPVDYAARAESRQNCSRGDLFSAQH